VTEFQQARGLHASGQCDDATWTALVEASYRLGDRTLLLTAPNMRGDDVAELQSILARLGFDCGRVDGILGPSTTRALEDF
jgi:N-acetylmuramoyl-L-alanine amidase